MTTQPTWGAEELSGRLPFDGGCAACVLVGRCLGGDVLFCVCLEEAFRSNCGAMLIYSSRFDSCSFSFLFWPS